MDVCWGWTRDTVCVTFDLNIVPQTDLSEWGSDGLLKDPVGVNTIRHPVPPSTFTRRLRTWWHLLSSRLREMVAHATLAEKNTMVLTHYASQTPLGTKSLFLAKIFICEWQKHGTPTFGQILGFGNEKWHNSTLIQRFCGKKIYPWKANCEAQVPMGAK